MTRFEAKHRCERLGHSAAGVEKSGLSSRVRKVMGAKT